MMGSPKRVKATFMHPKAGSGIWPSHPPPQLLAVHPHISQSLDDKMSQAMVFSHTRLFAALLMDFSPKRFPK